MKRTRKIPAALILALPMSAAFAATINVPADFATIQAAVTAAAPGDTVQVAAGTYNERLDITKNGIKLIGAGIDVTTVDYIGSATGQGGIYITGNNVELRNLTVTNSAAVVPSTPRYGIKSDFLQGSSTLPVNGLVIDSVKVTRSFRTGLDLNGVTNVTVNNFSAVNNGGAGIFMTDVKTAALSNITTSGNPWTGVSVATLGQFFPVGTSGVVFSGTNSFGESSTANGAGQRNGGLQFEFGSFATPASPYPITWSNQLSDGANVTIQSADFTHMVSSATFDNSNKYRRFYNSLASASAAATGVADHINTPRYIQAADDSNDFGARVTNFYVTPGMTIQAGIDGALAGDVVNVTAGSYLEDVNVNKALTLSGAAPSTTTIIGKKGGSSTGVVLTASGAIVEKLTITREGNNTTDWNDPTLNSAGVSIQGTGITGTIIRNNTITGNRTGIDINNSSGHSILNNRITDNRTGLIFRNQTDNLTVTENEITNNWTVGIVFLDGSGGSNSPVQTAAGCTFSNNKISGNWYGGVVDRQSGGSLPAPGTNLKNFNGNWWGVAAPARSTSNSAEPGYAAQIPVAYGGAAVPPVTAPADILGPASANLSVPNVLGVGTDTNVESSPGRGTYAFQGNQASLTPLLVTSPTITGSSTYASLSIAPGSTVIVTSTGTLNITGALYLGAGATLQVRGGTLNLGDGSTISGNFTIFNSFGSWNINGNTTFNVSQSLALVSDVHVAAGVTVTVNGNGELIFDGCSIDSQTPGSPYNITAATDGLLTIARSVVSDANISINTTVALPRRSQIYDSRLVTSSINVAGASTGTRVFHNIFNTVTSNSNTVVDGWSNVASAASLQNRFALNYQAPALTTRTLDANGNLFVQPGDPVVLKMDVSALGSNTVVAAEALLGYKSDLIQLQSTSPAVTAEPAWDVIYDANAISGVLGSVDSALGLDLIGPGDNGISTDSTIAKVNFTALAEGQTANFFRVQTNGVYMPGYNDLLQDTRLTASSGGVPSYLTSFTSNSGDLIIDDQDPTISVPSVTAVQTQPLNGTVSVLTPPTTNYVFRNGAPVTVTFTATDAGLAGLDAPDASNDLAFAASNGFTTLNSANYTVVASGTTVVTYTVTLNVPVTATTGVYTMSATVIDRSGNSSPVTVLGNFTIANEANVTVQLESFVGTSRAVTFVATNSGGTVLATWTKTITNFNSPTPETGSAILENVPAGTAAISAKTAWTLRSKLAVSFSPAGVTSVSFTGVDKLLGGDLTGDNVINTLDYSTLRFNYLTANAVADITGDGTVNLGDYNVQRSHFFTVGDPQ